MTLIALLTSLAQDYVEIIPPLAALGYDIHPVTLPSVGAVPADPSDAQDVAAIRAIVSPLVNAGKTVYVVGHSYGTVPASDAIKGLLLGDMKAQNKPGGVAGIIYLVSAESSLYPLLAS